MENPSIEHLKELKAKLVNREMSVLVGAGFSKNFSNSFLSWNELLFDLVYYLFDNEIEDAYSQLNSKKKIKKEDYVKNKVESYIKRFGYLDIVSMYIKQKGIRESIITLKKKYQK